MMNHEHKSHFSVSPWTEMYSMFCQDDDMQQPAAMYADDEQQPTHDALVDVYNRDGTGAQNKRVFVNHN